MSAGLILAAPASGSGKTVVPLGRRRAARLIDAGVLGMSARVSGKIMGSFRHLIDRAEAA